MSSDSTPMNGVSSGGDRVDSNGEPSPKENNLDGASNANGEAELSLFMSSLTQSNGFGKTVTGHRVFFKVLCAESLPLSYCKDY